MGKTSLSLSLSLTHTHTHTHTLLFSPGSLLPLDNIGAHLSLTPRSVKACLPSRCFLQTRALSKPNQGRPDPQPAVRVQYWHSCFPGCVPLRGLSTVTGAVGESLSVRCQYEEKYKSNTKYWCRHSRQRCKVIVWTTGSKEARNGRVSIRDHPATLSFTVTLENLTLEDAGTYKCVVDRPYINGSFWIDRSFGIDDFFKVVVSVVPGKPPPCPGILSPGLSFPHERRKLDAVAWSLLSSIYFNILVFLELPLLLSMLSAVLWVNRPQRCSGEKQHHPDYENQ
ncbi:CMRF-35-like molecule 4 [Lemmus lemmus]